MWKNDGSYLVGATSSLEYSQEDVEKMLKKMEQNNMLYYDSDAGIYYRI